MIFIKDFRAVIILACFSLNCIIASAQTTFTCPNTTTVCACPPGAKGEYYSGYFNDVQTYFTANAVGLTRIDNTINFNTDNGWGAIVPPAGGVLSNPDYYSTRWTGSIRILTAGTYTFYLTSDDASWLWMGTNALAVNPTAATAFINNGGLHSPLTISAVGVFPACRMPFKLHFGENGGNNRSVLEYESVALGIVRQVVPQAQYCSCQNSILPIELRYFSAIPENENIKVQWGANSESNNKKFSIFKSIDGTTWDLLDELKGEGTTNLKKEYTILDQKPFNGINYYYLLQTNNDGSTKKYDIVYADYITQENYISLFPNPSTNKVIISSINKWVNPIINVYGVLGTIIHVPIIKMDDFSFELNTTELSKGSYTVKISDAQITTFKKLLKE
jgi:hypothetical protein